jgi:fluoride exporter
MSLRRHSSNWAEEADDDDSADRWEGLDEIVAPPPVQNPNESAIYRHRSLEETRREQKEEGIRRRLSLVSTATTTTPRKRIVAHIHTLSHLAFFSLLGTLARLGIQGLSTYPNTPATMGVLWANFAGCAVMGFLSEVRGLVASRGAGGKRDEGSEGSGASAVAMGNGNNDDDSDSTTTATKQSPPTPLTVGLSTGFCGSLTSFSSFARDAFLALSNTIPPSSAHRSAFSSFLALVAAVVLTLSLSLSGLQFGAHIAIILAPILPSMVVPFRRMRPVVDWLGVVLGLGCWAGAVIMAIYPPDRRGGPQNPLGTKPERWRMDVLFALPFAPLGTLLRFYSSLLLNPLLPSFPVGTFTVNITGSFLLATAWDLQHSTSHHTTIPACQVLQGIQDGFCGCLTTVSTWAVELRSLRRRHAYTYGTASILVSIAGLVGIMGGVRWSKDFMPDAVCG